MAMYKGGTVVERGFYWNPVDGERIDMKEDGILPADRRRAYLRISPAGLLLLAPFLGMMFVMFLPLFGIGVFIIVWLAPLIAALGGIAVTGVKVCCGMAGKGVFSGWNPTRMYFSGGRKKSGKRSPSRKREEV